VISELFSTGLDNLNKYIQNSFLIQTIHIFNAKMIINSNLFSKLC